MSPNEKISSEEVLEGRLIINVYRDGRGTLKISIGSVGNKSGSMTVSPLELAALLEGPLQRALAAANQEEPA